MKTPAGVLLLGNSLLACHAKTTGYLGTALRRLGIPTYFRDTAKERRLTFCSGNASVSEDYQKTIRKFGIDTVVSLDAHWYLELGLFVDDEAIQSIHSVWYDDLRSWCTHPLNPCFPTHGDTLQGHLKHPKVTHHFYGGAQATEARILGIDNQRVTRLAAPVEMTLNQEPCQHTDRMAFIGNPGFRGSPHAGALKLMEAGADLDDLRAFSRDAVLRHPDVRWGGWIKEEPSLRPLLAGALEAKRAYPFQSAMELIQIAGASYPRALDYINEKGIALELAFLVKLVNRYDRPAFVHRLWKRGYIDVYSAAEEWKPYGVKALPYVDFDDLPAHYRMYSAHLNAPNAIRDATANEKLFEIAACGRLSVNLASPDVNSCYDSSEIVAVDTLNELEAAAGAVLRDPQDALTRGEAARKRTSREHLWEHRASSMLTSAEIPSKSDSRPAS